MYFMPASFASFTHSSALNLTGLKRVVRRSYSLTGTRDRNLTHEPRPGDRLPFHCPAGTAYSPQWMNMPYFTSRNHSRRCSLAGSGAAGEGACAPDPVTSSVSAVMTARVLCMVALRNSDARTVE